MQATLQDGYESEIGLWAKERVGDDGLAGLTEEEKGALGLGHHEDVDESEDEGEDQEDDNEVEQGDGWLVLKGHERPGWRKWSGMLSLSGRKKETACKERGYPDRLSETSSHLLFDIVRLFAPLTDFMFPLSRT